MLKVNTIWKDEKTLQVGDEDFQVMVKLKDVTRKKQSPQLFIAKKRSWLETYMQHFDELQPKNIVEVGIFQGGSTAFLDSYCKPDRLAAIDIENAIPIALENYLRRKNRDDHIQVHTGIDQGDKSRISELINRQFGDTPIDLVLDDASHLLAPTRATFECLFPMLRPGGIYIIEDWNWEFFVTEELYSQKKDPMAHLIMDLAVTRSIYPEAFSAMTFDFHKITITKGNQDLPDEFKLGDKVKIQFMEKLQ